MSNLITSTDNTADYSQDIDYAPSGSEWIYSKDRQVKFDPGWHCYFKGTKQLIGVTSYISQFKNPFPPDAYIKYALKHGLDPETVKQEWQTKGKASRDAGHVVHRIFEHYKQTGGIFYATNAKERAAVKFIQDFFVTGRLKFIEAESMVYSTYLASFRDAIVQDQEGRYYILDWKTNEVIKAESFNQQRMLYPFQGCYDCDLYHYSIQLQIYKRLSRDYPIYGTFIIHIDHDAYKFITPVEVKIPDDVCIFDNGLDVAS